MRFNMIAFDADDTLWHSESFYHEAQQGFTELLASCGVDSKTALEILHRIEIDNLPTFGYGIKGFTLSMVEASIDATDGQIQARDIQAIINLGRAMTSHEIRLLDGIADIVETLAHTHPLMLITKGDLMDQERKLAASGLMDYFRLVEIVSDKTPEVYRSLLQRHKIDPERFLMIGNSIRSDILPVLELGGWAVYVPYELTWAHETGELPAHTSSRFTQVEHLRQIPDLIRQIEESFHE